MIDVPLLQDLGFARFSSKQWREHQQEVVSAIVNSKKKFIFVQAPTGAGKSPIAMAAGKLADPKRIRTRTRGQKLTQYPPQSAVVTATKQLQKQYLDDFDDYAKEVKGRGNFNCLIEPVSAAEGLCTISGPEKCEQSADCPYYVQRDAAFIAPMTIHSYAYILNTANYSGTFSQQTLMVLDEGHLIDDMLMSFIAAPMHKQTCQAFNIPSPAVGGNSWSWSDWQGWAMAYSQDVQARLSSMAELVEHDLQVRNTYKAGKRLLDTMLLLEGSDDPWIIEPTLSGWEMRPTWIAAYGDGFLYRHAEKVVIMSATILDYRTFARVIGVDPEEADFVDVPSSFPVGSRPIYYDPAWHGKKGNDMLPLAEKVYDILRMHPDEKGLVHCVSYDVMNFLAKNCPADLRRRVVTHGAADRLSKYEEFRNSSEPLVLFSPSMKEGVSLEDDMCRFIIVAKQPFPYLGSPQIAARMKTELGKKWYPWKTACDLIQMTGRGMRSAEDYCSVYLLDSTFENLFRQMKAFWPTWFTDDLHDVQGRLRG